ncbi:hypothetical protein Nepgr_001607 [Nepenthes gracilis]|uniref:DUF4378 domain-containing protein n=1 Tax=Nepenthes gracilis TaxID=150966 RepID=A0AAD3P7G2_NEPGR|nr:hypothetical protein Nepgr_001607 [Nepenthes gracilis]
MAAEKKGSKGRFLHLFDWNAKSRKTPFSKKPDLSEGNNQEKENVDNVAITQFQLKEIHANEGTSILKGSGNHSCALPVSGDDGHGNKAPGVVARLMGLDSLPTSSTCEPSSVSVHEPHSLSDFYYPRSGSDFEHDPCNLYHNMPSKLEGFPWKSMDSILNKVHGQPIDRFQTEVLPPKSAKPISITHHKLLSPIRSPVFVPTNDAAYIVEASARIIGSIPRPSSVTRTSFVSSSAPLRVQDRKNRIDASRLSEPSKTPQQSVPVKHMRENFWNRSVNTPLFKPSTVSDMSHLCNLTNKGKFVSLSIQEKSSLHNMQKKEGSASGNSRSLVHKEHKQVKLKQSINSLQSSQKNEHTRNSTNKSSGVVRHKNEQSCISHKVRSASKTSISNLQSRKAKPFDGSAEPRKIVNKVFVNSGNGSKKTVSSTTVTKKIPSLARMRNISRNKGFVSKDVQFDESITDHVLTNKNERYLQRDLSLQSAADRLKNMDVISFTFTSPIKKCGSISHSYCKETKSNGHLGFDSSDLNDKPESKASFLLLEEKLKELTERVVPTQGDSIVEGIDVDSTYSSPDSVSPNNVVSTSSVEDDLWSHKIDPSVASDEIFSKLLITEADRKWKESEGAEEHSSCRTSNCGGRTELDLGHHNASITVYPSSNGSCLSSNSTGDCTYGNEELLLLHSQEVNSCMSTEIFHQREHERNLSDTASSTWIEELGGKHMNTAHSVTDSRNTSNWEYEYVTQILCHAAVNEYELGLRYVEIFCGSHKAWAEWRQLLPKQDWLAAELCKEISYLKSMGSLMLDELLDKDMSTKQRRWLDFASEVLEEVMEIEREIESSLVDELIIDLSMF